MEQNRVLNQRDLAYETISSDWASFINGYDSNRRFEVLLDEMLDPEEVKGKSCLDAGTGLGYFAKGLLRFSPQKVVAVDIAPSLVSSLKVSNPTIDARVGDLMDLSASLADECFDVVVSSEVIEHTPNPEKAVKEICKHVAKGGTLIISCPNARWKWVLAVANMFGLRKKYQGYENWVKPDDLTRWIEESGLKVQRCEGIHVIPWIGVPKRLLRTADRLMRTVSYPFAVNLAVRAVRS